MEKYLYSLLLCALFLFILVFFLPQLWPQDDSAKKQKRADVRQMTGETLTRLYKAQPSAKKVVESAAGYAVFSNFGMKIFVAGGGSGKGLAVNNKTKKETFMKMVEVQAGFGLGVKKFKLVWVFENQNLLNDFTESGWTLSGQTTAAAKLNEDGGAVAGAMSVSPGIWLYQMTDDGLALELTEKGTKYYKDDALN